MSGSFYLKIPNFRALTAVKIQVSDGEKFEKSLFHLKTIRSRQMILENPEILVCFKSGKGCISAIMTNEFYRSGFLQNFVEAHKMKIVEVLKYVTPALFKLAFEYTMSVRLSPHWNKVGSFFIQDKHFLINANPMEAVVVTIYQENERDLVMNVNGFNIQTPPPGLNSFITDREDAIRFITREIDEVKLNPKSFFKFPSMLTATTKTLHRRIPKSSPFRDYVDMRRHWKNMYGYRLPESIDGIYFVSTEVRLGPFVDEKLYPSICGRFDFIKCDRASPDQKIIESFVNFLYGKMSKCCGYSINIVPCEKLTASPEIPELLNNYTQNISLCTPSQVLTMDSADREEENVNKKLKSH